MVQTQNRTYQTALFLFEAIIRSRRPGKLEIARNRPDSRFSNSSGRFRVADLIFSPIRPMQSSLRKATVLGGGAYGTAMAQILARGGKYHVKMWVREPEVKDSINFRHTNDVFLKDVPLNDAVTATNDFVEALQGTNLVYIVIPTPFLRSVMTKHRSDLPKGVPLICCTKGIENGTLLTPYEILIEELPGKYHETLCALSGPTFAREAALGMPSAVLCASRNHQVAESVQAAMSDTQFRIYTGTDIIGAELAGAIKNVLAIACGAARGYGFGSNTSALLMTRGLVEMTRLAVKKGADPATMMGLAGMGDLVLTCTSTQSRNYTVGSRIAKGETLDEIIDSMKMVAEGVKTAKSVHDLAAELDVEVPICEAVYEVLHKGKTFDQVLHELQARPLTPEKDAELWRAVSDSKL